MIENTKKTYAASMQRASFVGSLDVEFRSVPVTLADDLIVMPDTGRRMTPCTGRPTQACTESPGTEKPIEWVQATAAARRQPSTTFH